MALLAQRLVKGPAERDTHVLDGVMGVDLEVAVGRDVEVHQAVARDLVEHVIEKRQATAKCL